MNSQTAQPNTEFECPGNLLVVDDTPENLRLLASMLGEKGYEVRPVSSGRQALQAAERLVPELILLDINMPEMDGYEVCRQLKSREDLREVPVIFLTALTDTADKLKGFAVGGVDYVSKPFQIDEVLARVKVHIALRRAQKQLADNYNRLRELETLREKLVHMIVHDMRSPLAVICANLELFGMIAGHTYSEQAGKTLKDAALGVENLVHMTNDLLDVSKMEEGKMTLNREPINLVGLAKQITENFSVMDPSRTITVESEGSRLVFCDGAIMRRVLQNLLSNAIKHTPDGSPVRITIENKPQCCRVSVIDQGRGVPLESRRKIFEKFGALESRADRKYHSVGLGLAFSRLALEAHGGTIAVDSNEPKGSVFWFELPA